MLREKTFEADGEEIFFFLSHDVIRAIKISSVRLKKVGATLFIV
jgi:hypothetical protein